MKFIIFSVALSLAAADDCKRSLFDQCNYDAPFTSVYAETIEICEETCNIYAGIGSCDYFTYTTEAAVDSNCEIFVSDQTLAEFQADCNTVGRPITSSDECIVYDDTCEVEPPCISCTACGTGTCAGYMESNCMMIGGTPIATFPVSSINLCNVLCAFEGGSFFVIDREADLCECYDSSVMKDCKMRIVQQGTDINACASA